ncbi:MAG: hypothetical protein H6657_18655 [Ardenticatenaceae bacterium]|nr:hypothetical protein [Ardenticatenaceae bacterium]
MGGSTTTYKGKKKATSSSRYRCPRKIHWGKKSKNGCTTRNVAGEKVEELVWDFLVTLLLDDDLLFSKIEERKEQSSNAIRIIEKSVESLILQNKKDEAGIERLLDLVHAGAISTEKFMERKNEIDAKINERQQDIEKQKQQLTEYAPLPLDRMNELKQLQRDISHRLNEATFEQKRQLLDLLQVECVFHDDTGQIVMSGVFGSEPLKGSVATKSREEKKKSGGNDQSSGSKGSQQVKSRVEGKNKEEKSLSRRGKHMHITDSVKMFILLLHCSLPQSVMTGGAMLSFSMLFSKLG